MTAAKQPDANLVSTRLPSTTMHFDLTDEESSAFRKLLTDAIEYLLSAFASHSGVTRYSEEVCTDRTTPPAGSARPDARRGCADRDGLAILSLANEIPARSVAFV